jgi:hypothetical protein
MWGALGQQNGGAPLGFPRAPGPHEAETGPIARLPQSSAMRTGCRQLSPIRTLTRFHAYTGKLPPNKMQRR